MKHLIVSELLFLIIIGYTAPVVVSTAPTFQVVPFPPCTEERALDAVRRVAYTYGVDPSTRLANITFTPAVLSRPCNASFQFVDPPNDPVAMSEYHSAARLAFYLSILQPYAISEVIAAQNISWLGSIVSIPTPVPSPIPTAPAEPLTKIAMTVVFDPSLPSNCSSFTQNFAAWMSFPIDRVAVQALDCPRSISFSFTDASDSSIEPSADNLLLAANAQSNSALLRATGARAITFSNLTAVAELQRNLQPVFAENVTNTLFSLSVDVGSSGGPQGAVHNILQKLSVLISTAGGYSPIVSSWLSESTLILSLHETAALNGELVTQCFFSIQNDGIVNLPTSSRKLWWVAGAVAGPGAVGVTALVLRRFLRRRVNVDDSFETRLVQ